VWVFEKQQQLRHRHAPSFIRHVLDTFWQGTLSASEAAEQLGLSRSRLYGLAAAGLGPPAQATVLRTALPLQLRRFRGAPAALL